MTLSTFPTTRRRSKQLKNLNNILTKYNSVFDLTGRACIAFIFAGAAIRKIIGYERFGGMMEEHGMASELLPLVIVFEIACGLALALGWQTRTAALLLAGFTVLATVIFHMDWSGHFSVYLLFSKNIAIFGVLLFIVGHGSGRYSLDARRAKQAKS